MGPLSDRGVRQGSPTPGLQSGTGHGLLQMGAAQQEVSGGPVNETSLALPPELCLLSPPWWKNCLPRNLYLVWKRLGTARIRYAELGQGQAVRDGAVTEGHAHGEEGRSMELDEYSLLMGTRAQFYSRVLFSCSSMDCD